MAISAEELNIILTAKDREFAKAMAANERRIAKFAQKANKDLSSAGDMFDRVAIAAQGLAAIAVFQQLATSVKAAADRMGDLADAADSIGITTDALQELRYAAQMSGVQQDTLQKALVALSKNLGDAAGGGSAAKDSLNALGLSASQLASVPLPKSLEIIADRIAAVENPMQRATLAADLFGKSGVQMINMLSDGSDGLARMREEAQAMGVVINEDIIRQAQEAGDKLDAMSLVISSNLSVALINLAPILISTAQAIAGLTAAANDFLFGQMNADNAFAAAAKYAGQYKGQVQEIADAYSEVGKAELALSKIRAYDEETYIPDRSIVTNAEMRQKAARENLIAVTEAHKENTEVIELETIVIEDNTQAQGRSTSAREKSKVALEAYTKQVEALGLTLTEFESISSTIQSSMENAFMGVVDGTMSAKDAFRSMAADIIKELYRVLVVQRLVGSFATAKMAGSGILGAIGGALGITGNAAGGMVQAGQPSVVGEHGRELFVPSSAGRVLSVPQAKAAVNGGGGVTVVQNINISTGVQQTVRNEIRSLMPQIADSAKAAVADAKRRGGSYGSAFA